jgi:diguanylate cyclase (GGDEF)-like protein
VRLIDRNDTSLAVALVASATVMFQQPLRLVFDLAHELELRYHIAVLPGLVVLIGAFAFHEYRKRQQARAAAATAEAQVLLERARSTELERLVAFGRALGGAIDPMAMRQVFWRHLPIVAHDRELWMVTRSPEGWEATVRDVATPTAGSSDVLEALAADALAVPVVGPDTSRPVALQQYFCFPMVVGETAVGVVGVRNTPELTEAEQNALSAAVALLAIAIRNGQLLAQTRENGVKDALTGCFNRTYAIEALSAELRRAARTGRPLALMMLDIDEFKTVNDRFGHLAGDAMLAAIGARLATSLRGSDVKCRYGGDEFLIVMPDTPLNGAEHVASAIASAVADLSLPESGGISPTVSVGVASAGIGELDATSVIARADEALYRAKREGRNRFAAAPVSPTSSPLATAS